MTSGRPPRLSVVIPTLDEARHLPGLLRDLRALGEGVEVVVSDGGSGDGTVAVGRRTGARVIRAARGRGAQLRSGAEAASGPWLLFLHADSRVGPSAARAIDDFLAAARPDQAAHFAFELRGRDRFWRFLEAGQRLRERLTGLVYGDQGLLISRALYNAVGGHPAWPLMEDVEMVDRVRRAGTLVRLDASLTTSARRYRREGRWRAFLRNAVLITLFRLGVDPARLRSWYAPEERRSGGSGRTLLVFAKAPRPGTVKTRLAASVGDAEAVRIYRALGAGVVDSVRDVRGRTIVSFAPPDARREMEAWLGSEGLEFHPQVAGDLGRRMAAAFDRAFADGAPQVCVVGTDAPGVDAELVDRAFTALRDHDVVVGPAADGGYYLLALDRPRPELFQGVPWSTPRVLPITRARIREMGLREHLLPELRDVDRLADVPPELLAG